ncbi:Bromodomain-containing protein [Hesseltinella vesiculosa]|uniref:Bromodomain-containing protein n=1 Tax=Hesseltinella vesiculosa TaxID=101127 RepID=A0A1X2GYI6_9FUNG|nr:Bromodomain-containing protein [Hesseltinella vesiculosa]
MTDQPTTSAPVVQEQSPVSVFTPVTENNKHIANDDDFSSAKMTRQDEPMQDQVTPSTDLTAHTTSPCPPSDPADVVMTESTKDQQPSPQPPASQLPQPTQPNKQQEDTPMSEGEEEKLDHTSDLSTHPLASPAPALIQRDTFEIIDHEGSSPKPLTNGTQTKKRSRTPSPFTSTVIGTNMTKDQQKYCMAIMRNLKKHRDAAPFLHPVDYVKLNIPDYPNIIKTPIDLTTIEHRLHANEYLDVGDFVMDIRLLFNNCYKFNGPEAMVSMLCQNVESAFEKSLRQMPPSKALSSASSPHMEDGRPKREIHPPPSKDYPEQLGSIPGRRVKLDKQMRFCVQAIRELKKTKYRDLAYPFLQPVDYVALNIPDYPQIVTHPMDISTIERKLTQGDYESPEDFESDVRLMFNNCYRYNPPALPIHKMAQQFEKVFDDKWKELPEREPTPPPPSPPRQPANVITRRASNFRSDSEDDSMSESDDDEQDDRIAELERHIANISQQIASIKSEKRKSSKSSHHQRRPSKSKKKDAGQKRRSRSVSNAAPKRRRTSSVSAPKELPEFSFEQKKDLSERINNLSGDRLNTVVTIIQNSMPHLDGQGQEEIVLDIDALDRKTLHELHEFVTGKSLIPKPKPKPRSSASVARSTSASKPSRPRSHSSGALSSKSSKKKAENDRRIKALEDALKQMSRQQGEQESSSDSESSSGSDSDDSSSSD